MPLSSFFLIALILASSAATAFTSANVSVYSSGMIAATPTATPIPPHYSPNLAPFPDTWTCWRGPTIGEACATHAYPITWNGKICARLDYDVLYVAEPFSATNEINHWPAIPVKPGDHVVLKVWFWVPDATTSADTGAMAPYAGATLNIDLESAQGRMCAIGSSTGKQTYHKSGAPYTWLSAAETSTIVSNFGTKAWEQITMDFIMAGTYESDGWGGMNAGIWAAPTAMRPLICISTNDKQNEHASIYVADVEIHVNP